MEEAGNHRGVKDLIENLLFLSQEPLTVKRLAESLPCSKEEIAAALDALQAEYENRGLKLRCLSDGWMFTTEPFLAQQIEDFYDLQRRRRLTRASLETLAIIAYNQPVTRSGIEAIRGVQTSGTIQTLLDANLIKVIGQKETLGNPFLYGTTDEFLSYFGLSDASELPPLEFEKDRASKSNAADQAGRPEEAPISEEELAAEITPVDFGLVDEESRTTHAQQKGA
jgi:segregation and condensation protein B